MGHKSRAHRAAMVRKDTLHACERIHSYGSALVIDSASAGQENAINSPVAGRFPRWNNTQSTRRWKSKKQSARSVNACVESSDASSKSWSASVKAKPKSRRSVRERVRQSREQQKKDAQIHLAKAYIKTNRFHGNNTECRRSRP